MTIPRPAAPAVLTAVAALAAVVLAFMPSSAAPDDAPTLAVQPSSPAPGFQPPPPGAYEPAPAVQGAPEADGNGVSGQWVYTSQYGWVWMPHGDAYVNVPATGDAPNMYVYYPSVGWAWVVAPWVWGWGP